MSPEPAFLNLDEVLALQQDQIARYGGQAGLRDQGLLSSALAMPRASFGDEYLHPSIEEMAAAYLFHLAKNHPFLDGNKRIALAASLAFLWLNDLELISDEDPLTDLVLGVADGTVTKAEVATFIARHVHPVRDRDPAIEPASSHGPDATNG